MTSVQCIVAKKDVTARACLEAQRDNRCWCIKAVVAIQAVGPEFDPEERDSSETLAKKRRGREELVILRGRCTGMLKQPPSKQYAGPAIAAAAGQHVAQPLSSGMPLPAAPRKSLAEVWREGRAEKAAGQSGSSFPSKKEASDEREDEHEAAIAEQEGARTDKRLCAVPGCGSLFSSTRHEKCWRCRVGQKSHRADSPDVNEVAAAVEATIAAQGLSHATTDIGPVKRTGEPLDEGEISGREPTAKPSSVVQPGPTGGRENPSDSSPRSRGRKCSVEGCDRVLADKTKGDKCAPCLKGIKPGSGWEPCVNAPACPRMTQRWKDKQCALCRQGKKYHLVSKPKEKPVPRKNPLAEVTDADFKAAHEKYGGETKALGEHFGASAFVIRRRVKALELNGKTSKPVAPRQTHTRAPRAQKPEATVPAETPKSFAGMPAFEQVPIGWTVGFLKFLRDQSVAVDGIGATGT